MKRKKLSEKQHQNMTLSRKRQSSKEAIEFEALLRAHQNRFLLCESLTSGEVFQIHNNKRFQAVVGDKVLLSGPDLENLKLSEILPRRNLLERLNQRQRAPLAANIDLACMVFACQPEGWPQVLAQYRCYLKVLKIPHIVIINKIDIGLPGSQWCERLKELEHFSGDKVFYISAHTREGIAELEQELTQKTAIFLGPSGTGKSSLLKTMLGENSIKVGELSQSERGTHTTSVTQYYPLASGGLIDSPGVRQFSLEQLSLPQLLEGFEDFKVAQCRFHDCEHILSQGCAVPCAIEGGFVGPRRYEDYLFLKKKFEI